MTASRTDVTPAAARQDENHVPPALETPSRSSTALRLLLLLFLAVIACVFALSVGAAGLPIGDVVAALTGSGDALTRTIVLELRLPRVALALVAGAGLALAGAVFQAVLRNALAEPYVLGVAGGAAVGAVGAVVFGLAVIPGLVQLAALAGAIGAMLLVLRIALRVGRALDTRVLLLAGVVVGAFFNAVILLLLMLADVESFRSAVFWMMGSLSGASWRTALLLTLYVIPAIVVLLALARPLNLLAIGEETALFLGTRVQRVKLVAYFTASLLVAAAVSACGVIGFIGLIVPHAVRLAWGSDHRLLLPASALGGGTFLLLADTAARSIAAPAELPVGVVTALVGVPIFVLLLRRSPAL
ncbi:MAG TPA: iron ABC transporter permease [Longimicrobiales bacterium]|nr:iron ABC transporter permease [Longimicrobiales bacterium]